MRPHEPDNIDDHRPPTRRRNYSLFFFQQEGQRSYLRFTTLGAILSVLIIIVPIIAILTVFFINSRTPFPDTNVNIRFIPATPYAPVIRQAPLPPAAKNMRQPTFVMPTPPIPPPLLPDTNPRPVPGLTPRPTAQPTPSASPP